MVTDVEMTFINQTTEASQNTGDDEEKPQLDARSRRFVGNRLILAKSGSTAVRMTRHDSLERFQCCSQQVNT